MDVRQLFRERFGAEPRIATRAPGRVNLIGEHIDYNGGHVLPMAIDFAVEVAISPRGDDTFHMYAAEFDEAYVGARRTEREDGQFWANYVFGVIAEFVGAGHGVPGLDVAIVGDVPRGSGLSSSAAIEVAVAWALRELTGSEMSRMEIALLCQRAENVFVGVNCGIMDQAISACGEKGHALLLDCNALTYEQAPLDLAGRAAVLVAHSGVRRGLSASAYNERRTQCDEALEAIRKSAGRTVGALCEATLEELEAATMPDVNRVRARHAITEEQRVRQCVEALGQSDLEAVGQLLNASHASLRDDYAVSCEELDDLTEMIRTSEGAFGSRLTGAGFGGCTVSLVAADAAEDIVARLRKDYYEARGMEPILFTTEAEAGVRTL